MYGKSIRGIEGRGWEKILFQSSQPIGSRKDSQRAQTEKDQTLEQISQTVCSEGFFVFQGKLYLGSNTVLEKKNCSNCRFPGCEFLD